MDMQWCYLTDNRRRKAEIVSPPSTQRCEVSLDRKFDQVVGDSSGWYLYRINSCRRHLKGTLQESVSPRKFRPSRRYKANGDDHICLSCLSVSNLFSHAAVCTVIVLSTTSKICDLSRDLFLNLCSFGARERERERMNSESKSSFDGRSRYGDTWCIQINDVIDD